MHQDVPNAIEEQVVLACDAIQQQLADSLLAIHLYGSALDGGLKPLSDIDLLVTVARPPDTATLHALQRQLLDISAPPGQHSLQRALEVTVLVHDAVVPWRHPAWREFQFGEWQRPDILAGILEPPVCDPDIAIVLRKAHAHSIALYGPAIGDLLHPIPDRDFLQALADTLTLWNGPDDWRGDEANVVLTLARIWYSAKTGHIAAKDAAADWLLPQLPSAKHAIVTKARRAYLGLPGGDSSWPTAALADFILSAKASISSVLQDRNT